VLLDTAKNRDALNIGPIPNSFVLKRERDSSQAWRYMPVIPALGRLRQEDCKF
jgi:hypothetical protein